MRKAVHTGPGSSSPSGGRGAWPGTPRPRELARDAVEAARAQVATTLTLVFVLATVCFAVLVTTGQTAAAEARVVEQIDSAGTRLIVLSDESGNAGILPVAPASLAGISDVSWVIGLGAAQDVTNPLLPDARVASRALVGDLPADLNLVQGRAPRAGEAVVGADAVGQLHLRQGLGTVRPIDGSSDPIAVVGVFEATGPLAHLDDTVLVRRESDQLASLRYLYVMASDVRTVDRLSTTLTSSTPALDATALTVETPSGALALRDVVAGRLGAASRQLMALVMGVAAVLIAVTMLSATVARRRDFGRRRALGATRSALVTGLLLQTALGATLGILLGVSLGLATLQATTGSLPTSRFTLGVAGLALLLTLLACAPVATHAAHRDPLRILRVP